MRTEPGSPPLLLRVYRHSLTRFLAFSAFGLSFDLTVLALLNRFTPLPPLASVAIAFVLTYALNFVLNRYFAFSAGHGHVEGQLARFLPQVTADFLQVLGGVSVLTALGMPLIVARVLSAATNAVLNYCAYRWWTFRGSGPTSDESGPTSDGSGPVSGGSDSMSGGSGSGGSGPTA